MSLPFNRVSDHHGSAGRQRRPVDGKTMRKIKMRLRLRMILMLVEGGQKKDMENCEIKQANKLNRNRLSQMVIQFITDFN